MCLVNIRSVNGLVPLGATDPTHLRVTGRVENCPNAQVTVTTNVTGVLSFPATVDPATSDWYIDLLITLPNLTRGYLVSVTAEAQCVSGQTCQAIPSVQPLDLATLSALAVTKVAPLGRFETTDVNVAGVVHGCYGNQVDAEISVAGLSYSRSGIAVDSATGRFTISGLHLTSFAFCDNKVTVTLTCVQNSSIVVTDSTDLDYPECFRAHLMYAPVGPCIGTQRRTMLNAELAIDAGTRQYFKWDFDNGGLPSNVFLIDNTLGTGNSRYLHSESCDYDIGKHFPTLIATGADGSPIECPTMRFTVEVTCADCPTGTVIMVKEDACVYGKRTVTLEATVTAPANSAAIGQWDLGYAPPGGSSLGPIIYVPAGKTQTSRTTWVYPPGTYTACVKLDPQAHPNCTDLCTPVNAVNVSRCPPPTCEVLLTYSPNPVPCLSTGGKLKVDFEATLNPPNPAYTGPFTWEVTKSGVSLFKVTQNAPAVTNPHQFSYDFTSQDSYDVTVTIQTPGCSNPFDTDSAHLTIEDCCPKLIRPLNKQEISACEWFFWASVDNPNNVPLTFDWTFHDGTTQHTNTPSTAHTYARGSSPTGNTTVVMHATVNGIPCLDQISVSVTHRCTGDITPTTITCDVKAGTPGTITVTFSEDVNKMEAEAAANFAVKVNGTTRTPTSLTYDSNAHMTTLNGITINPSDRVEVVVTNVHDQAGNVIQAGKNSTTCQAPPPPKIEMPSCAALLWAAIVCIGLGAILVILACVLTNLLPALSTIWGIVNIIGWVLFGIGWFLLLLWLWLCSKLTPCDVILAVRTFVGWLIVIFAIVAAVLKLAATFWNPSFQGCFELAAIYTGNWGLVYKIINDVAENLGCLIKNQGGNSDS